MAVYFIQDCGTLAIKIGFTVHPEPDDRLKALQTGNSSALVVLATMPGNLDTEKKLHQRFSAARIAGEWFRPVPELVKLIASIPSPGIASWSPPVSRGFLPGEPIAIYLAGKISKRDWRHSIVADMENVYPDLVYDGCRLEAVFDWRVQYNAIQDRHTYVGPFFVDYRHGQIPYGDDRHGVAASEVLSTTVESPCCEGGKPCEHCDYTGLTQVETTAKSACVTACLRAVARCDLLFAWIDQADCYGTITEISWAKVLGKLIWIAGPRRFRDMWFVYEQAADGCLDLQATDPASTIGRWLNQMDCSKPILSHPDRNGS